MTSLACPNATAPFVVESAFACQYPWRPAPGNQGFCDVTFAAAFQTEWTAWQISGTIFSLAYLVLSVLELSGTVRSRVIRARLRGGRTTWSREWCKLQTLKCRAKQTIIWLAIFNIVRGGDMLGSAGIIPFPATFFLGTGSNLCAVLIVVLYVMSLSRALARVKRPRPVSRATDTKIYTVLVAILLVLAVASFGDAAPCGLGVSIYAWRTAALGLGSASLGLVTIAVTTRAWYHLLNQNRVLPTSPVTATPPPPPELEVRRVVSQSSEPPEAASKSSGNGRSSSAPASSEQLATLSISHVVAIDGGRALERLTFAVPVPETIGETEATVSVIAAGVMVGATSKYRPPGSSEPGEGSELPVAPDPPCPASAPKNMRGQLTLRSASGFTLQSYQSAGSRASWTGASDDLTEPTIPTDTVAPMRNEVHGGSHTQNPLRGNLSQLANAVIVRALIVSTLANFTIVGIGLALLLLGISSLSSSVPPSLSVVGLERPYAMWTTPSMLFTFWICPSVAFHALSEGFFVYEARHLWTWVLHPARARGLHAVRMGRDRRGRSRPGRTRASAPTPGVSAVVGVVESPQPSRRPRGLLATSDETGSAGSGRSLPSLPPIISGSAIGAAAGGGSPSREPAQPGAGIASQPGASADNLVTCVSEASVGGD